MKAILLSLLSVCTLVSQAQYYYKDIIGTRESADLVKTYRANKVSRVVLTSYDADNTRSEDFYVEQQFSAASSMLKTISRSDVGSESVLVSYADAEGRIIRTIDSSNILVSYTDYQYNPAGQLVKVVHHKDRVESRRFRFPSLRDDGGKELLDTGAVTEIADLQSESKGHPSTLFV